MFGNYKAAPSYGKYQGARTSLAAQQVPTPYYFP